MGKMNNPSIAALLAAIKLELSTPVPILVRERKTERMLERDIREGGRKCCLCFSLKETPRLPPTQQVSFHSSCKRQKQKHIGRLLPRDEARVRADDDGDNRRGGRVE